MKISMIKKRKAQAGNQAAILVIVIAVLLVLFLLSIPPEDREQLLNNGATTPGNGAEPHFPDAITLLRANVGTVPYRSQNERIHELAPFNLRVDTQGEQIHTRNSMYLKNSVFEKISDTITFTVNPQTVSNVLLTFNVEQSSGSLLIKINGETIFNAPIRQGNSPPIHIPPALLRQENILEFQVSGPGAAFWRYNFYSIRDINIYGDRVDLSRSRSSQIFNVGRQEANEIELSELRYMPACTRGLTNYLTITVNHFEVYSGMPDCDVFNTMPIPTHYIHEGVNEIVFQLREGQVLVDRVRILNKLEQLEQKTYYFEVSDKYFNLVNDDYELKPQYESMLDLTFPNYNQKRFDLIINGKPINFNTARLRETRNMRMFLQPGTNSIQIEPRSELTITELRVRIRER